MSTDTLTWNETRLLPVALTQDELRVRGEMLAKLLLDSLDLEAAHKADRDAQKHEREALDGQITATAAIVRARVETRSVAVECRCNLDLKLVEEVRTDTGEVIRTRQATPDDKARAQLPLPDPGTAA